MAPSNAATISACVSTGSSFHCSIGRAICLSSTLRASSTRMPSFRPACMIAPTAQKRRAATDCTGTGMLSQLRAKERRHQRSSSAISSRARASTARASLMYSGRRLVCQAGIGLAMISRIAGGLVPKVITWPSSAGNRGTIEWHQYLPRYRRQFIAGRLLRASKSVNPVFSSRLRETIVRRKRDWTIQFGGSALPSHTISHLLPVIPASSPVSFRSNVFETLEPSSAVEDEEQCRTNQLIV